MGLLNFPWRRIHKLTVRIPPDSETQKLFTEMFTDCEELRFTGVLGVGGQCRTVLRPNEMSYMQ